MMSSLAFMLFTAMFATAAATPCENLASLSLPNTTITSARLVPAGPYTSQGPGGRQQIGPMLPAHCRVAAVLAPSADSHIEMEIWLPSEGWNGKFLAAGNGGFAGSISFGAMASGLSEGYAAASNDTGHKGDSAAFGVGHPEKIVDFGIRSMHEMAVKSKAIIGAFYDRQPRLSYYTGCSTGGMQGLSEAQRFPADFDAIVAGAPVNNQTHLHASQVFKMMEILADQSRFVPQEKIKLVARTVLDKCDAGDSVRDGFLSNPEACQFEPATLLCKGSDSAGCLTAGQVESLNRAYATTYTKSGKLVYPGHPRGFEMNWRMPEPGSEPPERPLGSFRFLGHQDPKWDWRGFELDTDLALVVKNADYEALNPDLRAFKARGGKLIIYHGLNDPGPSPLNTKLYYEEVLKTVGPKQDDWLRVFMMPGMDHCRGGVGPDQANFLGAMERWVESGVAPDRIRVSRVNNGQVDMTRPLCPYPQFARWTGVGSTNDAENFVCAAR
jgi:feruloyl esterase